MGNLLFRCRQFINWRSQFVTSNFQYISSLFKYQYGEKRNVQRFPKDFMFQLTEKEFKNLMSQNVISSWGGTRKLPYAFSEQGVAMLSSVLNSETAIEVNISIIRVFTKMREYALTNKEILMQLAKLEKEVSGNSKDIENIFAVLKELISNHATPLKPRNKIGFKDYD